MKVKKMTSKIKIKKKIKRNMFNNNKTIKLIKKLNKKG